MQPAFNRRKAGQYRPGVLLQDPEGERARGTCARVRAECRRRLGQYLLEHACVDCGEGDVRVRRTAEVFGYWRHEVERDRRAEHPRRTCVAACLRVPLHITRSRQVSRSRRV